MQCLEWGDVKKPLWQPVPVVVRDGDAILATALVLKRRIPRTRRCIFYVPRGPIVDWTDLKTVERLMTALREAAKKHRAILIKVDPAVPQGTADFDATIAKHGFLPSPDAEGGFGGTQPRTVMKRGIEGSEDEVLASFHQKWRYNIRLAAKKGVVVREAERKDLPAIHELYRVTAQRDGFTGRPLSYFEKLWDVLEPKGLAKFFITELEGKPLSAAICFITGPQCWYVYGASSNEHRNVMPNHAMQWEMIKWAKSQGCTVYDFRGVADETQAQTDEHLAGLNRFKAGFSAEVVSYVGEFDLVLSPAWYWLWTTARPKVIALMKRVKK
jgi:lipid II:glycine glycyltransferase (peptidoglycan interpeptide bridge formation enzyme)